ncbi:MAG: DUF4157 domain-containing protein, partial [Phycisphaerae bacterium]|nr:DUF4157 domain-containing protein [Saprospiraceae bacterium]
MQTTVKQPENQANKTSTTKGNFFGGSGAAPFFQAKLTVNEPGDKYEVEADAVAEKVVNKPGNAVGSIQAAPPTISRVQREMAGPEEKEEPLQRMGDSEKEEETPVQRMSEHPQKEEEEPVQRMTDQPQEEEVQKKEMEEEEPIQRKAASTEEEKKPQDAPKKMIEVAAAKKPAIAPAAAPAIKGSAPIAIVQQPINNKEEEVQAKSNGTSSTPSASFTQQLNTSKGSGSPLPDNTRSVMESGIGADFSKVRVHTDGQASSMSRDINAKAFTHGSDVYFNSGQYNPATSSGQQLLAHELTHTVQQGASERIQPKQVEEKEETPPIQSKEETTPEIQMKEAGAHSALKRAVLLAKQEQGKVNAGAQNEDGSRKGWERLVEYYKTSLGEENVIPEGGKGIPSKSVLEQDIKFKRTVQAQKPNQADPEMTVERDAMPSWCGIFVNWSLITAGVPLPKWKLGSGPFALKAAYPKIYAPKEGDVAYRDKNSHYGIVVKSEPAVVSSLKELKSVTVTTINGNTAGTDNLGGQIQEQTHNIESGWTAFFNPLFGIEDKMPAAPTAFDEQPAESAIEPNQPAEAVPDSTGASAETESEASSSTEGQPDFESFTVDDSDEPVVTEPDPLVPEISAEELNLDADPSLKKPDETPEVVAEVKAVEFTGNSEAMTTAVMDAAPSQMAASYGGLGTAVTARVATEQQETLTETPPLEAKNTGATELLAGSTQNVNPAGDAKVGDGITGPNGKPLKAEEHEFKGEAPNNENKLEEEEKRQGGEEGFVDWLKNNFKSFFGGMKTKDPNVDTSAGARPKFDRAGEADPERSKNSRQDSNTEAGSSQQNTAKEIATNNGQERVKPVLVEEKMPVAIQNEPEAVATETSAPAQDYLQAPLPEDVRAAADAKISANLTPKLNAPKTEVQGAAEKRDAEKKSSVEDHQKQVEELNKTATKEQVDAVKSNREAIADEQKKGVKESSDMLKEYHTDADKEQTTIDSDVKGRIKTDEEGADKELKAAEKKAEDERTRGEQEAAEAKRKEEEKAKNASWWERAKNAIKSVVKAITAAIDKVFNAVRKFVKDVIDAAKKAAIALIEAGRKWIVDKLNSFRTWLKDKVNKLLANFPALRDKINAFIDKTVDAAIDGVNKAADALKKGVTALADALGKVLDKILSVFQTALKASVQIMGAIMTGDFVEALKIAIQAACDIAGIDSKPVFDFFERAGNMLMEILKHPVKFIKTAAKGVAGGFKQFWAKIWEHLKNGVIGWLTGNLVSGGLKMPAEWDVKGIFSVIGQIVGLTIDNIKAKFKKAWPAGVELWDKIVEKAEVIGQFISKGPIALWEFAKDAMGNLKELFVGQISKFLSVEVIKQGIIWLLSLTNPASALVKAIKMAYDLVMFLIERGKQIVEFITTIFESVAEMAAGNVAKVSNKIEEVLGRLIPLVITLIAKILNLDSIAAKVRDIIQKLTAPIEKVITKVVKWLVQKGKELFKKVTGFVKDKAGKVMDWWKMKKEFYADDKEKHEVFFKGNKKNNELILKSNEEEAEKQASNFDTLNDSKRVSTKADAISLIKEIKKVKNTEAVPTYGKEEGIASRAKHQALDRLFIKLTPLLSKLFATIKTHSGTINDPIPVIWYKPKESYPPLITLTDRKGEDVTIRFGEQKPMLVDADHLVNTSEGRDALSYFEMNGNKIGFNLDYLYLVSLNSPWIKTGSYRKVFQGKPQKAFRTFLKTHGYNW